VTDCEHRIERQHRFLKDHRGDATSQRSNMTSSLVPWAWGINGCASVLSAILAILLAMSLGFSAVLLIAIGLYLVAAATLR
jgi:L-cystine uptake protein TcyP (sodium:dicarboxylate symporter family)